MQHSGSQRCTARRRTAFVLVLLIPMAAACGPRYARIAVEEDPKLRVELRAEKTRAGRTERGFSHPVTISSVRVANILSRIDVRKEDKKGPGERRPAVPIETLQEISAAISKGLAKADSTQEVVVRSVHEVRRLGLFSRKTMTGLVVWNQGDELVVHVTHVDHPVRRGRDEKLPEPWPGVASKGLRVVPSHAMVPMGASGLAVAWRDPLFRRSGNLRLGADGRAQRRTILLEETEADAQIADQPAVSLPAGLTPELLRELADLEERRRDGGLSEADYQRRRRALLGGAQGDGDAP